MVWLGWGEDRPWHEVGIDRGCEQGDAKLGTGRQDLLEQPKQGRGKHRKAKCFKRGLVPWADESEWSSAKLRAQDLACELVSGSPRNGTRVSQGEGGQGQGLVPWQGSRSKVSGWTCLWIKPSAGGGYQVVLWMISKELRVGFGGWCNLRTWIPSPPSSVSSAPSAAESGRQGGRNQREQRKGRTQVGIFIHPSGFSEIRQDSHTCLGLTVLWLFRVRLESM